MRVFLSGLLILASAAGPAHAALEAWTALGENALHSARFEHVEGDPVELFARCDAKGVLTLPKKYEKDYDAPKGEQAKAEKPLQAAKKYANIQTALADGYLPQARGFIPGMGLSMVHPGLVKDGNFDVDKPDMLLYVRRHGKPLYRLVGFAYAAGNKRPKPLALAKRKKGAGKPKSLADDDWEYEENVCLIVDAGRSATLHLGAEAPFKCKNGTKIPKLYRLVHWGLLYNPTGLFIDDNPNVEFVDRTQKFGAICPKPKEKGK